MLAARCGKPRPSQYNHALRKPWKTGARYLISTFAPDLPRPLGSDHDLSSLQEYLQRPKNIYPDIRPKLIEVAANSPLWDPSRPLPSKLYKEIPSKVISGVLLSEYTEEFWCPPAPVLPSKASLVQKHALYQTQGALFERKVTEMIFKEYFLETLSPLSATSFYNVINGHPIFRLIVALRLKLYCKRSLQPFQERRSYHKYIPILLRWAANRIAVRSEDEVHLAIQQFDNVTRYLGNLGADDPDLEHAVRRVSPVLGIGTIIGHYPMRKGNLGLVKPTPEDAEWYTDLCGDIMFLILHRGIKQGEQDLPKTGEVQTAINTSPRGNNAVEAPLDDVQSGFIRMVHVPEKPKQGVLNRSSGGITDSSPSYQVRTHPLRLKFDPSVGSSHHPQFKFSTSQEGNIVLSSRGEEPDIDNNKLAGWDFITADTFPETTDLSSTLTGINRILHNRSPKEAHGEDLEANRAEIRALRARQLSSRPNLPVMRQNKLRARVRNPGLLIPEPTEGPVMGPELWKMPKLESSWSGTPKQTTDPESEKADLPFYLKPKPTDPVPTRAPHGTGTTPTPQNAPFRLDNIENLSAVLDSLVTAKQNPNKPFKQEIKFNPNPPSPSPTPSPSSTFSTISRVTGPDVSQYPATTLEQSLQYSLRQKYFTPEYVEAMEEAQSGAGSPTHPTIDDLRSQMQLLDESVKMKRKSRTMEERAIEEEVVEDGEKSGETSETKEQENSDSNETQQEVILSESENDDSNQGKILL
ncbi:hypothetical protein TWF281_009713 [Arthrobotrys megalospora]